MSNTVLILPIVAGFILAFCAMWLAITGLLGRISGWRGLEQVFPDHPEPAIETLAYQSARMRGVNYNGCLRFEICATGLRVSVMRLLGPFQKPFFVPWGQIRAARKTTLFMKYVELTLGMRGEGKMAVRERAFERIAAVGKLKAA